MKKIIFTLIMMIVAVAAANAQHGAQDVEHAYEEQLKDAYDKWYKTMKKEKGNMFDIKIYYVSPEGKEVLLPQEKGKITSSSFGGIVVMKGKDYCKYKGNASTLTLPKGDLEFILECSEGMSKGLPDSLMDDLFQMGPMKASICEVKKNERRLIYTEHGWGGVIFGKSQNNQFDDLIMDHVNKISNTRYEVYYRNVQPGQYVICPFTNVLRGYTFGVE